MIRLQDTTIGVLGASSMVGHCLLPRLTEVADQVVAFSRQPVGSRESHPRMTWKSLTDTQAATNIPRWICVAPIWVLPDYFALLKASGVRRLVALSSTSRFTKTSSFDPEEQRIAQLLRDAEMQVQQWAEENSVEWIILRPTLIYGLGQDKNVSDILRFIQRFGFFPLFGKAQGLRQPIHARDVAQACVATLGATGASNQAFNISGGETLTYRAMVARIFEALERPVRTLTIPLWGFRLAVILLHRLPRYRHWSAAMAQRMNQDLVFDHSDATHAFGFAPGKFSLTNDDLP